MTAIATVKTTKVENYTEAQTAEIREMFGKATTHEQCAELVKVFAEKFGKATRSIVAKASREQVYIAKAYTTKKGEKPLAKDSLADSIGRILGLSDGEADSLAKANKSALEKVFNALANSKPF